ncbi:MAG: NADH-quinone oxidoreductase subunit J [Alphaproteobacteria bacterium]|nr:NADH-quinone oxidoreductase subunit J [Alphaproteobacteria bacterium]
MILEGLSFYLFAFLAIAAGAMVVTARNPVHSVLFLIFAFFNAAGLFVLLNAEFLAMILIIVYVGAVAVLFLFVVMMLDINFRELRKGAKHYARFGLVLGLVLCAELAVIGALYGRNFSYLQVHSAVTISPTPDVQTENSEQNTDKARNSETVAGADSVENQNNLAENGGQLDPDTSVKATDAEGKSGADTAQQNDTENLPVDSETASDNTESGGGQTKHIMGGKDKNSEAFIETPDLANGNNTQSIGRLIYTKYFLVFQLSGLVLLVAMIGAITLTLRHRGGVRRQSIRDQLNRHPSNSVTLAKVKPYDSLNESEKP